jgi:hypothetical protein
MAVPPHSAPYPPPNYAFGPPPPPRMPGLTTTAIVLMWAMVALSTIGAVLTIPLLAIGGGPLLGARLTALTAITAGQGLIWAGFRAYFAVKIARRSGSARTMAIVVEAVALACQLLLSVLIFNATMSQVSKYSSYNINFDITGLVLPILIVCFLSANRSRWWCDR